ncbi:MAG: enoyl-[acyl-carrier-protein] reductase FabL [Chloroflexi bacterium]|nr:enoyl-[acyl-carrier-protein] reductase FabL [Chloroflexota bacterium]
MSQNLSGKIALVTGGSRGIGKSIASELGRRGATVIINYLKNHEAAKTTVEELKLQGIKTTRIKAHVGEEAAIDSLVSKIEKQFGQLDILVNNAASGVMRPTTELSVKHWDWTMNINARGPWMLSVAASRLMPDGGRIINISSPGSTWVLPAYFAVGVSKAAIEAVTRYLAVELGPKGIAVNTVSPGFVMTEALNAFPDQLGIRDLASRPTPAGRTITPEDVSNVVAMLCSSDAEMIRGQVIVVDGGETLRHE